MQARTFATALVQSAPLAGPTSAFAVARSASARKARASHGLGTSLGEAPASEAHPARAPRQSDHPPTAARARRAGFTLIEIMAVVVIIGLLTGIVGTAIIGRLNQANATTAKTQIKQIEAALDFYRMDNGRYPSTEQGLDALVNPSSIEPAPRNFRPEGYLQGGKVPPDPWGLSYEYEAPGTHNPYGVDIWSFGADGQPGGTGADADVGNWTEDSG